MSAANSLVVIGKGFIGEALAIYAKRRMPFETVLVVSSQRRTSLTLHSGIHFCSPHHVLTNISQLRRSRKISLIDAWGTIESPGPNELAKWETARSCAYEQRLRLITELSPEYLIHFGSSSEFGPHNELITLTTSKAPVDVYGSVKAKETNQIKDLCYSQGISNSTIYPFQVVGIGQKLPRILPRMICEARDKNIDFLKFPNTYFDFVSITDLVRLVDVLLTKRYPNDIIFGSGYGIKLKDLYDYIFRFVNGREEINIARTHGSKLLNHLKKNPSKISDPIDSYRPINFKIKNPFENTIKNFIKKYES